MAQCKVLESEQLAQCQYEASRKAEQRYRAFLNFLPDPVFVFNFDGTVTYLNPAFERVFGWTLQELKGKRIPFVPESEKQPTRDGIERLLREKILHGFETKRLTRDGRTLDIVIDGAIFYDDKDQPAGQVVTLRDVTAEKRSARINEALFRIAKALYQFRGLDQRLDFITREVQDLMAAEGALVILIDEDKKEFFFRAASYEDVEAEKIYKETRYPMDKGVAAEVIRTGKPMIVPDYYDSPYSYHTVDKRTGQKTRNMIQVPMLTDNRMIGVLCAVNKKQGEFDQADADLLSTFASIVALPIENARIDEQLKKSYEEVKSLNRAKDQVIHRLSHELKTPVSVLSASLALLEDKLAGSESTAIRRVLGRSRRNLQRLLDMQYEIEDILQERDLRSSALLSGLLDACADELEALVAAETGDEALVERIRSRIDGIFGLRNPEPEMLAPGPFVEKLMEQLQPAFSHRSLDVDFHADKTESIWIPPEVLTKIVRGLIRNAVENTPDDSRVEVSVRNGEEGPELIVRDFGVGITEENQRLIFEQFFTTSDTLQYATRKPFDFNAGGRGFDLLRMKIFSERYHFNIRFSSRRCRYIPHDGDVCPGDIEACDPCSLQQHCLESGGTTVTVQFLPAAKRKM
ncbi:MAG: hypothetical protein AMJ54_05820 [Deltaproteobacteria bacterium SG8_13]|nr:MAG: hypothetical protein AMJ54_05820 [Deltaproteobacteria bacterium SG8_13]